MLIPDSFKITVLREELVYWALDWKKCEHPELARPWGGTDRHESLGRHLCWKLHAQKLLQPVSPEASF